MYIVPAFKISPKIPVGLSIKIKYSQTLAENSNDKFVYNISNSPDFMDSGTITNKE